MTTAERHFTSVKRNRETINEIRSEFERAGIYGVDDEDIYHMAWVSWYYVVQWGESTPENWEKAVRLVLDICGVYDD